MYLLNLYRRLIGVQIRSQMQYRTSFFLEVVGTALITLLEYASLALVFSRFGTLKGWTLGQVAFLYGLAEFSFGIMDLIFSGFDPGYFGMLVRRGFFDQLLLALLISLYKFYVPNLPCVDWAKYLSVLLSSHQQ